MRDIGIESLNAQGQLKGAIPLFQELATKMQSLSGGERIQILETVASKYNINILSSFLDELGKANSKFGQAVAVSAGANNQAYERQIELNKALYAEINKATVSVEQLFNKLAQIGVTENLGTLLKFVNNLVEGFNKLLDSEGVGGNIARGLVKGISDVFFTFGLPIIAAIFVKLTTDIAKFGVESLKTILGINQQARERVALEQAVVNTLIRDQEIMATILALSGNRAKQEEYLLGVYNRQLAALQQVQNIATTLTPALMAGGLSATSGQITKRGAGGYLPAQEAADVRRGVGGASASSKVVSIPNFAFGGGKRGTMIANTSEYVVPNFANGGSAIFNQNMVKAYGLPAGAKKISAAGGYVPNFANRISDVYIFKGKPGQEYVSPKTGVHGTDNPVFANSSSLRAMMDANPAYTKVKDSVEIDRLNAIKQQKKLANIYTAQREDGAVMLVPNLSEATNANLKAAYTGIEPKTAEARKIASMVRFDTFGVPPNTVLANSASGKKDINYIEEDITNTIVRAGYELSKQFAPLGGTTKTTFPEFKEFFRTRGGAAGAASAAAGAIFESSIASALQIEADSGTSLDVPTITPKLKDLFKIPGYDSAKADFKISGSQGNLQKFADQVVLNGIAKPISAAAGYIPNFAAGSPLNDAINREMAAGLKPSQIRVTTDGRLKNSQNPSGLAVINTRDEPNGKIPNFAVKHGETWFPGGGIKEEPPIPRQMNPVETKVSDWNQAKKANDDLTNSTEKANLSILKMSAVFGALTSASYMLEGSIKQTDSSILKFTKGIIDTGQKVSMGLTIGEGVKPILEMGSKLPGVMGTFTKSLASASPVIGAVVGGLFGLVDVLDYVATEEKRKGAKTAEDFANVISGLSTEKQIKLLEERASKEKSIIDTAEAEREKIKQVASVGAKAMIGYAGPGLPLGDAPKTAEQKTAEGSFEFISKRLIQLKNQQATENTRQKQQNEDQLKADRERLVLAKEINRINEAFSIRENTLLIDRVKNRIKLNESVVFGTQYEKDEIALQIKLNDLEEQKQDANTKAIQSTITQLKQLSALATVDKEALNNLIEKIQSSKNLENLESEINSLKGEGVAKAGEILEKENQLKKEAEGKLDAKVQETILLDEYERKIKAILETEKLRLDIIQESVSAGRKLFDIRSQGARSIEDLSSQTGVIGLQNQISRQPFATRSQEASLARLNAELAKQNEIKGINRNFDDSIKSAEREKQDAYAKTASELNMLTSSQKEYLQKLIEGKKFNEAKSFVGQLTLMDPGQAASWDKATLAIENADTQHSEQLKIQNKLKEIALGQLKEQQTYELAIINLREKSPMQAGAARAINEISKEAYNFQETFAYNTTNAFRDGLRDAMSAAISQTDDLNGALQNVAMNFLKSMQNAFMQNAANNAMMGLSSAFPSIFPKIQTKAKGGLITGGSGYRDDVPAMLTGGEFVMRKSAVQKYGAANLAKMNNGGIFLPGVRGGGAISGYDALRAFANQTTTSGATDVLKGGGSSAFINLEDQSSKLSRYALLNQDDVINQEIRSAQEQGLNIIKEREAYRTQQRKAMQQQLVSTVASAVLSAGIGALGKGAAAAGKGSATGLGLMDQAAGKTSFLNNAKPFAMPASALNFNYSFGGRAYGGMIRRYASGGPTDDIPALLMSGEYVMNRQTTSKYGKRLLDSMNQGRAPRFADGGDVGSSPTMSSENTSKMTGDVNISINVTGQNSETQTQGESNQGGVDYKKMSERIKAVVLETINEEKRLGGALRTR